LARSGTTRRLLIVAIGLALPGLLQGPAVAKSPQPLDRDCGRTDATASDVAAPRQGLTFVENRGQVDRRVAFYAHSGNASLWLARTGPIFDLRRGNRRLVFSQRLVGADRSAHIHAAGRRQGVVHHLGGNASGRAEGARTYSRALYRGAWPGIGVRLRGAGKALEQDYIVAPGARTGRIRIAYRGIERLRVTRRGALAIDTALGTLRESPPVAFQRVGGRRVAVEAAYKLLGDRSYGFELGDYRGDRKLVIDPRVDWSRYLGGGGASEELAADVATDAAGNVYVTGHTSSPDFPGADAAVTSYQGGRDAFVTKLDAGGTVLWTTYVGTEAREEGAGVVPDAAGNVYLVGHTTSRTDLATAGAAQAENGGGQTGLLEDAFALKLAPSGASIAWATYLGGYGDERAHDVTLDGAGNLWLTGQTTSRDFPTAAPAQAALADSEDLIEGRIGSFGDAFVTQVAADGSAFLRSSFYGGGAEDQANGIALDGSGNPVVAGTTESPNLSVPGGFQGSLAGPRDAFAAMLPAAGGSVGWGTYLGGTQREQGFALALDGAGRVWLAGQTQSQDFPLRNALEFDEGHQPDELRAFAAALAPNGSGLPFSTTFDGTREARGIALSGGDIYFAGTTTSAEFPSKDGFKEPGERFGGDPSDGYIVRITSEGELVFASPLGGNAADEVRALALGPDGGAYVAGQTFSPNLPGATGAGRVGSHDGFVMRMDTSSEPDTTGRNAPRVFADIIGRGRIRTGRPASYTVVVGNSGPVDARAVPIWIDGIPENATWELDAELRRTDPRTTEEAALFDELPETLSRGDEQLLPLFLPVIPAGATGAFRLTLTIPEDTRFTLRAWADPPIFTAPASGEARAAGGGSEVLASASDCLAQTIQTAFSEIVSDLLPLACLRSIQGQIATVFERETDAFFSGIGGEARPAIYSDTEFIASLVGTAATCAVELGGRAFPPGQLARVTLDVLSKLAAAVPVLERCREAFTNGRGAPPVPVFDVGGGGGGTSGGSSPSTELPVESGSSMDPNDKAGPAGAGGKRWTGPDTPLRYVVFFENLATATASAEQVVITDRLDPSRIDLDSVRFGPVSFGARTAGPAVGASALSTEVDLRPARDVVVRITGALDRATGVVTWRFSAHDPDTGGPPEDPLEGVVPPNRTPPEGEGSVTLFADAVAGLKTGARISNQARIVFDQNEAILTPAWTNRIDRSAPRAAVRRVADKRRKGRIKVRWAGRDRGAGVGQYDVYVSQNGKRFRRWQTGTTRERAKFKARRGRGYAFRALAMDRVGNVEGGRPTIGESFGPALRARRRGRFVEVSTRIRVDRRARLAVSARSGKRKLALARGSRVAGKRLKARGANRLKARVGPGAARLRLRFPANAVKRTGVAKVKVAGRGESMKIRFRR